MEYPILSYPDPAQGYILYTDTSRIGWFGVLTQEHTEDKGKSKNHPICYVSGQFCGSQLNWAALTKEAYTINMSIKKLSFYVTDADFTIRSYHLPLKNFLNKQMMNSKVNIWAVELEQFRLHLEWIPGSQNLVADSLSHLIDMVTYAQQPDEHKDHEFGSYCFKELEPAKALKTISTEVIEMQAASSEDVECSLNLQELSEVEGIAFNYEENLWQKQNLFDDRETSEFSWKSHSNASVKITKNEDVKEITLLLKPKQLQELQKNDIHWRDIAKKLHKDRELQKIFIKEKGILYRLWAEDGRTHKCMLVPQVLQDSMVILAHDYSRHNGSRRTYNCLKKQYYWLGIRKQFFCHCKKCAECILQNQGQEEKGFSHFDSPNLPMQFICMDLVGPIHPPSS